MKIAVDFDDTITMINEKVIDKIKLLKKEGHEVFIFTARPERLRSITAEILAKHGLSDIDIEMDKPAYDVIVDEDSLDVAGFLDKDI